MGVSQQLRRLGCRLALVLVALVAFALPVARPVLAATWYVNAATGSDQKSCRAPGAACATIGGAIAKAAAGDTINVAVGTYAEFVTIGQSLAIVGAGSAPGTGSIISPPCCGTQVQPAITVLGGAQASLA